MQTKVLREMSHTLHKNPKTNTMHKTYREPTTNLNILMNQWRGHFVYLRDTVLM